MVAYDPHQATMMVTTMVKEGFPVVEYRPVVLNFSEPMKELDALTKARTIAHGGCPVMEWEMSNVVAAADKKDNVYPNKPREEAKIDNPVALISALGRGDEGSGRGVFARFTKSAASWPSDLEARMGFWNRVLRGAIPRAGARPDLQRLRRPGLLRVHPVRRHVRL
jgi:phage terminase large subunit-like protein